MPAGWVNPDSGIAAVEAPIEMLRYAGITTYDGEPPARPAFPYVSVYTSLGTTGRTTLAAKSDRRDGSLQTTIVGETPEQVRGLQARVRGVLVDSRPVVAGRRFWPLAVDDAQPIRPDRDVTPPVFYAVDRYPLSHVPS